MSAPDPIRGSCYCKAIRFELTPPTKFFAHCHCPNCRRAHSAAFASFVGIVNEQFRIADGEHSLVRFRTETDAIRSFCKHCGTTLFYEGPRWPGETHVSAACLDDVPDQPPKAHVYVDHKADWCQIPDDGLVRLGGTSGVERKPKKQRSS